MADTYIHLIVFIQELESGPYWSLLALTFLITAGSLWWFFRALRHRRLLQDTPTSKIRSASQGYVEISGRARALDGALKSPGKLMPCVWYRLTVQDMRDSKRRGFNEDDESYTDESQYSFYVDDGTGMCSIDPMEAQVRAKTKDVWKRGYLKFTEQRIVEGEHLYCVGEFRTVQGFTRQKAIRETTKALLHAWKADQDTLQRFDANGDGKVDLDEWARARDQANKLAKKEVGEDYQRTEHHELVKPFERGHPFVISAFAETELTRRYAYEMGISLTVFLLSGFGCITIVHATLLG